MKNEIYSAPRDSQVAEPVNYSSTGKVLAILGSLFLLCLPISLLLTVLDLIDGFQSITLTGSGDPKIMAGMISSALVSTILGLVLAFPGFILVGVSVVFFNYRKPWLFYVALITSLIGLMAVPIGTVLAIVVLFVLIKKRKLFFNKNENNQ